MLQTSLRYLVICNLYQLVAITNIFFSCSTSPPRLNRIRTIILRYIVTSSLYQFFVIIKIFFFYLALSPCYASIAYLSP